MLKKNSFKNFQKPQELFKLLVVFAVFAILSLFLLSSCSQSKPKVSSLNVKLLKLQTESESMVERLSVFLEYSDEDGQIDFDSLNVIHKKTGLSWTVSRDDVSFFTFHDFSENHYVVGTNKIAPALYRMPLGEYQIKINDLGHNSYSLDYILNEQNIPNEFPFAVAVDTLACVLKTKNIIPFDNYAIILLGSDRQTILVERRTLPRSGNDSISLDDIKKKSTDARYFQIMFEKQEFAFLSKIYNMDSK